MQNLLKELTQRRKGAKQDRRNSTLCDFATLREPSASPGKSRLNQNLTQQQEVPDVK
jgi:hypothetical protein